MFGFAHGGVSTLFGLGLPERMTGRRKRFAYHVKHGPLVLFLSFFAASLLHSMNRRAYFLYVIVQMLCFEAGSCQ